MQITCEILGQCMQEWNLRFKKKIQNPIFFNTSSFMSYSDGPVLKKVLNEKTHDAVDSWDQPK